MRPPHSRPAAALAAAGALALIVTAAGCGGAEEPPAAPPPPLRRAADGQVAWPPPPGEIGTPITAAPPPVSFDSRGRALPVVADRTIPCPGGQTCFVRDSRGGWLLPGPNVWDAGPSFVWADGAGLHLNVRPRSGCNDWASAEAWHTKPLG